MSELEGLGDLAALPLPALTSWLRHGALNWSRESDQRARLLAFSPATLLAHVPNEGAAGTLADELTMAFNGDSAVPAEVAVLALEGWSLPQDGSQGAAFIVQLAGELAAPRLQDGLDSLINKPSSAFVEPSIRLGSVISTAVCERLSRKAAEQLGADARRIGLISEEDAARILVYVCSGRLDRVVELVAEFRIYQGGPTARAVLTSLLRRHDPDEIGQILARNPKTAAQTAAREWVREVASAFSPLALHRRAWRARTPQGPTDVWKSMRAIEDRLGVRYPHGPWAANRDTSISTFNSKENIDPSLDSTVVANIYNIEAVNARRR